MKDRSLADDGLEQLIHLEEKIHQTIALLQSTRAEKEALQAENDRLRREISQQQETTESLAARLALLERERDSVRGRVQKLLEQVDALAAGGETP